MDKIKQLSAIPMKGIANLKEKSENIGKKSLDLDDLPVTVTEPVDFDKKKRIFSKKTVKLSMWLWGVVFIVSLSGYYYMRYIIQSIENEIKELTVLYDDDGFTYNFWKEPPSESRLKIHIFNYTNVDEYLSGEADKLEVTDIGPYVYLEKSSKKNINFVGNRVTYQEYREQNFSQELSGEFQESDQIVVPNVLAIGGYEAAGWRSFFVKSIMTNTNTSIFKKISVSEFLWGYSDDFLEKVRSYDSDLEEQFGILKSRKGLDSSNMTIFNGQDSLKNLGKIHSYNNQIMLDTWDSFKCNMITGSSNGEQFNPYMVEEKDDLTIFMPGLCRNFRLEFDGEHNVDEVIPVYRYKPADTEFQKDYEGNECYKSTRYSYDGTFNIGKCLKGVPMIVSYPHFYQADPELRSSFEGLNPQQSKHELYVDIYPPLGLPVAGKSRFQFNILLRKESVDSRIKKDLVLPILWVDASPGELSNDFFGFLSSTVDPVPLAITFAHIGFFLLAILSLLMMVIISAGYFGMEMFKKEVQKKETVEIDVKKMETTVTLFRRQ